VHVLGSGFDQGTKAEWAIKGVRSPKVVTNSTRFVSSGELVANITIAADADVALYDVIVTTSTGKPGIGTETFEVTVQETLITTDGEGTAINESGQVVGTSGGRAVMWENGIKRDLGIPAGFTSARAEGINNFGHVVGYAMVQVGTTWNLRAFLWTPQLGLQLLPGSTYSTARAINDAGVIVGYAKGADGKGSGAVWVNGALTLLPNGAGEAYDVNSAGQVVGDASGGATVGGTNWGRAYRWSTASGLQFVSTLRGSLGEALGINDDGAVVGWGPHSTNDSLVQAYVSKNGVATNLVEGLQGGHSSVGMKVSRNGLVAGRFGGAAQKPALWLANGSLVILNARYSGEALDVNSGAQVLGYVNVPGRRGYTRRVVVWKVY
jgi:probable HAF family extracellular repeat protein